MNLIFKIFCFSLLFLGGSCKLNFKCRGMISKDTAIINQHEPVTCSCSDDVNPLSRLSFKINNEPVNDTQKVTKNSNLMIFARPYNNETITLKKNRVYYWDAGYYTCVNEFYNYSSSIYVWIKTTNRHFLARADEETATIPSRDLLRVPCIPTSPCYNVKLFADSREVAVNETNNIKFDPREGFIIKNRDYIYAPIHFTCSITMHGKTEKILHHFTGWD